MKKALPPREHEARVLGMKIRRYGDRLLICCCEGHPEGACRWRWWGPRQGALELGDGPLLRGSALGMDVRRNRSRVFIRTRETDALLEWVPLTEQPVKAPPRTWPDRYEGEDAYLNNYPGMRFQPEWELLDDLTYQWVIWQAALARLWVELDAAPMPPDPVQAQPETLATALVSAALLPGSEPGVDAPVLSASALLKRAQETPV